MIGNTQLPKMVRCLRSMSELTSRSMLWPSPTTHMRPHSRVLRRASSRPTPEPEVSIAISTPRPPVSASGSRTTLLAAAFQVGRVPAVGGDAVDRLQPVVARLRPAAAAGAAALAAMRVMHHHPVAHAPMESFFGSMKTELDLRQPCPDLLCGPSRSRRS